jgi:pilus assembly protein Flp/PilA
MKKILKRLWKDEEGQDLIEYALLVALVALAATAGMNTLATAINAAFAALGTSLTFVARRRSGRLTSARRHENGNDTEKIVARGTWPGRRGVCIGGRVDCAGFGGGNAKFSRSSGSGVFQCSGQYEFHHDLVVWNAGSSMRKQ